MRELGFLLDFASKVRGEKKMERIGELVVGRKELTEEAKAWHQGRMGRGTQKLAS